MSEDEVNARFDEVLNDAYLADVEAEDQAMEEMREEFGALLDSGVIPIHVHEVNGTDYISIPADIMHSLMAALTEYTGFAQHLNEHLEQGEVAMVVGPMMTDLQIKALTTKAAFITLAYVKHVEKRTAQTAEDFANGEVDG